MVLQDLSRLVKVFKVLLVVFKVFQFFPRLFKVCFQGFHVF